MITTITNVHNLFLVKFYTPLKLKFNIPASSSAFSFVLTEQGEFRDLLSFEAVSYQDRGIYCVLQSFPPPLSEESFFFPTTEDCAGRGCAGMQGRNFRSF